MKNLVSLLVFSTVLAVAVTGCGPAPPLAGTPVPQSAMSTTTPAVVPAKSPTTFVPSVPTSTQAREAPSPTPSAAPPSTEPVLRERHYPGTIKAVFQTRPVDWLPNLEFLRGMGINTIIIHFAYLREWGPEHRLAYPPEATGEYELVYPHPPAGPPSEDFLRQVVITARAQGFAVMLGPMVGRIGDPSPVEQFGDWDRFKSDSIETIVRWATVAEELEVEYFMPFCELNFVLFEQEDPDSPGQAKYTFEEVMAMLAEWDSEALPRIRSVFSGKVISQIFSTYPGSLLQYPTAGYDIVGIAYHEGRDIEGATTRFRSVLDDVQALAQRGGVDWMVVEMDVYPLVGAAPLTDPDALAREAELWALAVEEYMAATSIPPAGFGTFLERWSPEGRHSTQGTPSEEVLREFFARLDSRAAVDATPVPALDATPTPVLEPMTLRLKDVEGGWKTVEAHRPIILEWRWAGCTAEAVEDSLEAFTFVVTLDERVAATGDLAEYRSAVREEESDGKSVWVASYSYPIGAFQPGSSHSVEVKWQANRAIADGCDYDGDGAPDLFGPGIVSDRSALLLVQ